MIYAMPHRMYIVPYAMPYIIYDMLYAIPSPHGGGMGGMYYIYVKSNI